MRSPLLFVLFIYIFYAIFGGTMFYILESYNVLGKKSINPMKAEIYTEIRNILLENGFTVIDLRLLAEKKHLLSLMYSKPEKKHWNRYDTLFFALSLVTTVGYGDVSPKTNFGILFCMFYILFGVPLNMCLFQNISELHSYRWQNILKDPVSRAFQSKCLKYLFNSQDFMLISFSLIVIPGIIVMHLEKWTFFEGLYYGFISLSTIGFGDFVTGASLETTSFFFYKMFKFFWFLTGISYFAMIFSYCSHFATLHFTHAVTCRNKRPGIVRVRFSIEKLHYHDFLFHADDEFYDRTEERGDRDKQKEVSDIESVIERVNQDYFKKMERLKEKRVKIVQWMDNRL